MRWLMEFVGVADADAKTGLPKKPKAFCKDEDVSIEQFDHGKPFDLNHSDAVVLSNVWKGCTQASLHPTTNTSHPPVDPPELAESLFIVLGHLEKHLYSPNGFNLLEVLQDQEHRRKFPLP